MVVDWGKRLLIGMEENNILAGGGWEWVFLGGGIAGW